MAGEADAKYVDRGRILVMPASTEVARRELAEASRKKPGRPFLCPKSLVIQLALVRALFGVCHRELEELLAESLHGEFGIGFVQIWRRVSGSTSGSHRATACSRSTTRSPATPGKPRSRLTARPQVGRSGAWKLEKWKVRFGFVRLTLAVHAEDKMIIAMTVTGDATSKLSQFPKLLRAVVDARAVRQDAWQPSSRSWANNARYSRQHQKNIDDHVDARVCRTL